MSKNRILKGRLTEVVTDSVNILAGKQPVDKRTLNVICKLSENGKTNKGSR